MTNRDTTPSLAEWPETAAEAAPALMEGIALLRSVAATVGLQATAEALEQAAATLRLEGPGPSGQA